MKKNMIKRIVIYLIGTAILSLGITCLIKSSLGISPISSVSYVLSKALNMELGNITFIVFVILVLLQIPIKRKQFRLYDLLQIPFSLVFSKLITVFNSCLTFEPDKIGFKILFLLIGIVLMGIGAGTVLAMRLPPNAGDGFVQAVADVSKKSAGFCKNIVDLACVVFTLIIGFINFRAPVGIGIGTLVAVLGVGRVIAFYHKLMLERLQRYVKIL